MDAIIDENKKSWLQRFILWREKKIREKHFILILSFLAGIFTVIGRVVFEVSSRMDQGISD